MLKLLKEIAAHCTTLEQAERAMPESCGIEYVNCGDARLGYVNTGDTYDMTICQEDDGALFVCSWGDWFEETENEQNADEGTITCGNCSARTPLDDERDWSETRCDSCGCNVSDGTPMPETD